MAEADKKYEFKPTMSKIFPKVQLNYPVSPKENLKTVLDKKKPLWIPNMNYEKTLIVCPHDNDRPPFGKSGKDWFGVDWSYVETADGQMVTPNTFIMESPLEWEEKLIFPNLDELDFTKGREEAEAKTDKSVLSFYLMQLACRVDPRNPFAGLTRSDVQLFLRHMGSTAFYRDIAAHGARVDVDGYLRAWQARDALYQQQSRRYWLYQ